MSDHVPTKIVTARMRLIAGSSRSQPVTDQKSRERYAEREHGVGGEMRERAPNVQVVATSEKEERRQRIDDRADERDDDHRLALACGGSISRRIDPTRDRR